MALTAASSSWYLRMDASLLCLTGLLLTEEAEGRMRPNDPLDHPGLQRSWRTSLVAFHFQNESRKIASLTSPLLFHVSKRVPKAGNMWMWRSVANVKPNYNLGVFQVLLKPTANN